jgi:hypothetical protein
LLLVLELDDDARDVLNDMLVDIINLLLVARDNAVKGGANDTDMMIDRMNSLVQTTVARGMCEDSGKVC